MELTYLLIGLIAGALLCGVALWFLRRRQCEVEQQLAEKAEGYSGAEIEQAIIASMYDAYDQDRDIKTDDVLEALQASVPLSVTMREGLDRLRTWAADRARPAST